MGERKVLNKYYPPDFDPAKLPRGKRQERNEMKVRMMLPMSVRCKTCGTFMYKGTKFNTRKEDVQGETYLGIQIFRFYYRCTNCAAEFCMRTDPKTSDYVMEQGASRNYEPWREADAVKAEAVRSREEEERGNAMKALENRTKDSKREMDIMEALDEMRSLKARHAGITTEQALAALQREGAALEGDEEEGEEGQAAAAAGAAAAAAVGDEDELPEEDRLAMQHFLQQQRTIVRRLAPDSEGSSDEEQPAPRAAAAVEGVKGGSSSSSREPTAAKVTDELAPPAAAAAAAKPVAAKPPAIKVAVRAKRPAQPIGDAAKKVKPAPAEPPAAAPAGEAAGEAAGGPVAPSGAGLLGLIGDYGSSSGDEG